MTVTPEQVNKALKMIHDRIPKKHGSTGEKNAIHQLETTIKYNCMRDGIPCAALILNALTGNRKNFACAMGLDITNGFMQAGDITPVTCGARKTS